MTYTIETKTKNDHRQLRTNEDFKVHHWQRSAG